MDDVRFWRLIGEIDQRALGGGEARSAVSVAWTTYERTTGQTWSYETSVSHETGSNTSLWASE